jgi:hypothetical protein
MTQFLVEQKGGKDSPTTTIQDQIEIDPDSTDPMRTLKAPNGVTNIGGANVYAAKLATVKVIYSQLAPSDMSHHFITDYLLLILL